MGKLRTLPACLESINLQEEHKTIKLGHLVTDLKINKSEVKD